MQIQVAIDGEMQLSRRMNNIARNFTDFAPALEQSVIQLKEVFSGPVFDTQGEAISEQWSPLKKAYALRKAKKYPNAGILEATGLMRSSFVSKFDTTSAQIWNTAQYFKYHQSKEPRSKLPRRIMMKLTDNLKQMIVRNFQEYFLNILQ